MAREFHSLTVIDLIRYRKQIVKPSIGKRGQGNIDKDHRLAVHGYFASSFHLATSIRP